MLLVHASGKHIITWPRIDALVECLLFSTISVSFRRTLPELIDEGIVTVKAGDALKDPAVEEYGPFDAIHVGASVGHIPKVSDAHRILAGHILQVLLAHEL